MNVRPVIGAVFALVVLCACSSSRGTSNGAPADRETARMTHVVDRYKKDQILTGFDIKGNALVAYADTEKLSEMDDASENAMKADLLDNWVATWKADHTHQHAALSVVLQNYYGQKMSSQTKRI